MTEVAGVRIREAADVFAARQLGRELAGELGMDRQDQVRVAAAISEVGRSAIVGGRSLDVTFSAGDDDLVVTMIFDRKLAADGTQAASRLMDQVSVDGRVVRMAKRHPARQALDTQAVRDRLAAMFPASALEELRRDNDDLIATLEDLKLQKEQLLLLNSELEETNRGVMAMYGELSAELEATNQGVVALYAELDDKSERLREAAATKDRFWANVSHELRTPLHSIIGLAKLLAEDQAGLSSDQGYQVELIRSSGQSLLALVNDLLDVAKAESGQLQLDPAIVHLPSLLSRLRALVRPMTEGRPVQVVVSEDGLPESILTDEAALTGILRNLLSNAIKYTDSGAVRLEVLTRPGVAEFVVTDTGIGIPEIQRQHVFEEFYQVPGVRRGGTGLGLPYALRLARLLGGDLTLDSTPGAGTTAVLRLPDGDPFLATVVVADDDPGARQVLKGLLAGMAGQVVEAADGAQALAAVAAVHPDLVFADLSMPGVDGRALVQQLPPSVPAIVITGLDTATPRGAAALIRKDELTRDRLAFTIRRVTGGTEGRQP